MKYFIASLLLFLVLDTAQASANCSKSSVPYQAQYKGVKYNKGTDVRLRISNGGAGQSGLVGALASAFIDWSRENGLAQQDYLVRVFL
jgi:hypothetical protein